MRFFFADFFTSVGDENDMLLVWWYILTVKTGLHIKLVDIT